MAATRVHSIGRLALTAVVAFAVVVAADLPVAAQRTGAPAQPRIRALVISGGPFHDYILQDKVLLETLTKALPIDWTVVLEGGRATNAQVALYNTPNWAKGFDIVVHNECYADVTDETFIRKITAAHRGGVPAMVIHCAMHSYRDAKIDDWREFLGVTTRRHTRQHQISVKVADPSHPITTGGKADWVTPMDELYVIDKLWPNAKPIATAVSPEDQKEYALAWVNDYGGTRVFGTTLGHGNDTWMDPAFQDLLVRGFKWAIGKDAPAATADH
jgi:type 1 glutamine amidotransferase